MIACLDSNIAVKKFPVSFFIPFLVPFLVPLVLITAGLVSGVYLYRLQKSESPAAIVITGTASDALNKNTLIELFDKPRMLPAFSFLDINHHSLTLDDFRDKVVLLNIWATWCPPCLEEMPSLDRLQASLGSPDFQVLALSTDQGGVNEIRAFYDDLEIRHLAIFYDPTDNVSLALKIVGLPTTFLIDRQGRVLGTRVGFAAWDSEEFITFMRKRLEANTG